MNSSKANSSGGESCGHCSILAFGAVGLAAFLMHLGVVSLLVPAGLHPLAANLPGFLAAFALSFLGHSRWTFPGTGIARPEALQRFLLVAVAGFIANECLYWVLLDRTPLDYRVALLAVLALVACSTFIASKYWAFAHAPI